MSDHDHRGEYADDRHDHGLDYAERHHRHYDDEFTARGLREDLAAAEDRIRALEDDLRGALASIRVLDRLRPTCVICLDATADRQTSRGSACADCGGDLPEDGGPDPDRPETWAFTATESCAETSDGEHTGDWYDGGRCGACGLFGPEPDEEPEPEPADFDPGPEVDDEGGMSEYRYILPEDYERGQS